MTYPPSWYRDTTPLPPLLPPLQESRCCDVCVIGGGYTGLSAALELAQAGYDTVLLEAERCGWGASGRNGGQICTGYSPSMGEIMSWLGETAARQMWQMAEEAKDLLWTRVVRYAIDCDLHWGYVMAALKKRHVRELTELAIEWSETYGYGKLELLGRTAMAERVASEAYCAGLYDGGGGHLHPLRFALGLARAAQQEGARLFEASPVTALGGGGNDGSDRPWVETATGARVTAKWLLLCGNAYLGGLVPALRSHIMPVGTYILATAPMAPERAEALLPCNDAVADCAFVLDYFRRTPDHRLLFGGRVSYSTLEPLNLKASMRRVMLRVFPQLADVAADSAWGGYVAITPERTPHLGRLPGAPQVLFAHGFSGHGVALTGLAGKLMAEVIRGTEERFDLFARLPHRRFPGGPWLRMPSLVLAMLYLRLRDLL